MSVPLDSLPAELQKAIKKAFKATDCMDLYEGDAVAMVNVIAQRLDARRHQVEGAAEAARKLNLALGNIVSEE